MLSLLLLPISRTTKLPRLLCVLSRQGLEVEGGVGEEEEGGGGQWKPGNKGPALCKEEEKAPMGATPSTK